MSGHRRRQGDPDESDYSEDRRSARTFSPLNGHTKWVVGFVSIAIVAVLGFFMAEKSRQFDATVELVSQHTTSLAVLSVKIDHVLSDVQEIKAAVKKNN